jgi:hypothetical protein
MGRWLEKFIDHNGDGSSDLDDSDEVMGYLSASLVDGILTVTYKPWASPPSVFKAATERYLIERLSDS